MNCFVVIKIVYSLHKAFCERHGTGFLWLMDVCTLGKTVLCVLSVLYIDLTNLILYRLECSYNCNAKIGVCIHKTKLKEQNETCCILRIVARHALKLQSPM